MSSAAYQRARRERLRAERRCLDCAAALLPEWSSRCPECAERQIQSARAYRERNTARIRAADAARKRVEYWQDPEGARRYEQAKREDKKLRGECQECSAPACEDHNLCPRHRASSLERHRRMRARRAA